VLPEDRWGKNAVRSTQAVMWADGPTTGTPRGMSGHFRACAIAKIPVGRRERPCVAVAVWTSLNNQLP
jgi:hypothetical protein